MSRTSRDCEYVDEYFERKDLQENTVGVDQFIRDAELSINEINKDTFLIVVGNFEDPVNRVVVDRYNVTKLTREGKQ